MTFDSLQKSAIWQSALALLVAAAVLAAGYRWLRPELVSVTQELGVTERLAFAVKWTLPIVLWLAGCVGAVSQGRFWSRFRKGSAYSEPSPAIFAGRCFRIRSSRR